MTNHFKFGAHFFPERLKATKENQSSVSVNNIKAKSNLFAVEIFLGISTENKLTQKSINLGFSRLVNSPIENAFIGFRSVLA